MECPFCKAEMPEGSKFCANCGAHLSRICATCGHSNQANSNFCSDCGASLSQNAPAPSTKIQQRHSSPEGPAEHRQLSVMFCDLVDSVGLGERVDPESLRDILRDYQQRATKIVEAAGGLVARYHGDGILAYFGYPAVSEDDAERAIRAGLELIKDIESLPPFARKTFHPCGDCDGHSCCRRTRCFHGGGPAFNRWRNTEFGSPAAVDRGAKYDHHRPHHKVARGRSVRVCGLGPSKFEGIFTANTGLAGARGERRREPLRVSAFGTSAAHRP